MGLERGLCVRLGAALLFERQLLGTGLQEVHNGLMRTHVHVPRARAMFCLRCPCLGLPTHRPSGSGGCRKPRTTQEDAHTVVQAPARALCVLLGACFF